MLDLYLREFGFEERDTALLLALAQHGELSAGEISDKISVPRSSVYLLLKSLQERGMITEHTEEHGGISYQISGPSAFTSHIEKERESFQKKEMAGKRIAEILAPSVSDQISGVPRIRFYSGKKDIERMLMESYALWRGSIREFDITWWGFQDHQFVSQYKRWLEMIWKSTPADERVRLFSNETSEERERNIPGRRLKFFSTDSEVTSTIWILGDYVVMIYARGKPHYAFQFHDAVFAANLRQVFKTMWGN